MCIDLDIDVTDQRGLDDQQPAQGKELLSRVPLEIPERHCGFRENRPRHSPPLCGCQARGEGRFHLPNILTLEVHASKPRPKER